MDLLFELSNDNSKEGKCLIDRLFDLSSDGQTNAMYIERTFDTLSAMLNNGSVHWADIWNLNR